MDIDGTRKMNKRSMLLVVDTQYDFMMSDGALYVPDAEELIVPLIRYVKNLDPDKFAAAYFTMDTHDEYTYATSKEAEQFPPHCLIGTPGWSNVINLDLIEAPEIEVYVQHKNVFDMWAETNNVYTDDIFSSGTERDVFWTDLKDNIDTVYVCGVATDVCVYFAVKGLLERGFVVVVLADLTRGISGDTDMFVKAFPEYVKSGQYTIQDTSVINGYVV